MRLNSSTIQGLPVLRQHFPDFRLYLKSEGYSAETIRVYLICLGVIDRVAAAKGLDLETLAERHCNGLPLISSCSGKPALTNGFSTFIGYLAKRKLLVPQGLEAQIEHLLARYRRFLLEEAGLSATTADIHGRLARRFLKHRFKAGELQTHSITVSDAGGFPVPAGPPSSVCDRRSQIPPALSVPEGIDRAAASQRHPADHPIPD
jgi:hypothetical protein